MSMNLERKKSVNSISIVDDEPCIRSTAGRLCSVAFPGASIKKFENGDRGQEGKSSDIIWTDQVMPKKSGICMIRSLLDSGQIDLTRQRLILWSGYMDKKDAQEAVWLYRTRALKCVSPKTSTDGQDPMNTIIEMILKEACGDEEGAEALSRSLFAKANGNLIGGYSKRDLRQIFSDRDRAMPV